MYARKIGIGVWRSIHPSACPRRKNHPRSPYALPMHWCASNRRRLKDLLVVRMYSLVDGKFKLTYCRSVKTRTNEKQSMLARLIDWCFQNPRLFWAIVIFGAVGDAAFLYWYFQ